LCLPQERPQSKAAGKPTVTVTDSAAVIPRAIGYSTAVLRDAAIEALVILAANFRTSLPSSGLN